jgi:hypothetical protein
MPALFPVIEAALSAGACGAFLSGAGSTILAFSPAGEGEPRIRASEDSVSNRVARAMEGIARRHGVEGTVRIGRPTRGESVLSTTYRWAGWLPWLYCISVPMIHRLVLSAEGASVVSVELCHMLPGPRDPAMSYCSTRDPNRTPCTFEHAVMEGLARDGGLYVPTTVPSLSADQIQSWQALSYPELALEVMSKFISRDEIPRAVLGSLIRRSYATFSTSKVGNA